MAGAQAVAETGRKKSWAQIQAFLTTLEAKDYVATGKLVMKPIFVPGPDKIPGHYDDVTVNQTRFVQRLDTCKFKNAVAGPEVPGNDLAMFIMTWSCPSSLEMGQAQKVPIEVTFAVISQGNGVEIWNYDERPEKANG